MRRTPLFPPASFLVASIILASGALPRPATAQTYELLHAFEQAPRDVRSELCLKDGELYGVTLQGGVHDEGTIFKAMADGTIEVLHSFGGPGASKPWLPWGGLVWVPAAGAFFGTTWLGGEQDAGTVFRMQPGGPPEVIHHFQRDADGRSPQSTLLLASDGYVYGTTSYDGIGNGGTLFRFLPTDPAGTFLTFHGFSGAQAWQSEVTEAPDGLLYVTAPTNGYSTGNDVYVTGEVYRVDNRSTPPVVTPLAQISAVYPDFLGEPVGVVASTRALYVTTTRSYAFPGAVIRISLSDGSKQVIHRFAERDGRGHDPSSALVIESDVNVGGTQITRLVGTTSLGGAHGVGTAFRLEVQESSFGITSSFQKIDDFERPREGQGPRTTLVRAPGGEYFGATGAGAIGERGSVFRLDTSLAPVALIGRPRPGLVGSAPAGLTEGPAAGVILGVTWEGGDGGQGTAFTFDTTGASSPIVLTPFEGEATTFGSLQASRPVRVGSDDYATLRQGGVNNQGAIVRISPDGSVATVHSFDAATEGYQPQELVLGPDGRLYGALVSGWSHDGAIFAFSPDTGLEILWRFSYPVSAGGDGMNPMGRLTFDPDGVLYGVTNVGGLNNTGTVFSLRRSGAGWAHTVLRRLVAGTDGSRPWAGLVLASDGRLYGTTGGVGYGSVPPSQFGTVFRINPDGSGFELLHTFSGDTDSCTPAAALVEAPDGWLYGTAYGGYFCQEMPGWWGSLFRVGPQTGAFETLHTFDRADGGNPWASLLPMMDGSLIGSATYAGPLGGGVLFRIAPPRVEPGGPYTAPEGGSVLLAASCSSCPMPVAFAWDLDGNGTFETAGPGASFSVAGLGGPATRSLRVRATYGAGIVIFADAEVTVTNVTPTVDAGPDGSLIVGETFAGSGSFADPGPDSWSGSVDYGDGTPVQALVLASKAFAISHRYTTAGSFTVSVTVGDGAASGTDTLSVQVLRVEDSIGGLIEDVRRLVGPPGPLNGGQGDSLISKLQGALDQLAKGNVTPAINKLEAFVNEVEAYIRSGKLTEAQGRSLVLAAQRVIAALL